jgi:hypothetical protein
MPRRQRDRAGAAGGQRLQLTIRAHAKRLRDGGRQDALGLTGLGQVMAETAQLVRQRRYVGRAGDAGHQRPAHDPTIPNRVSISSRSKVKSMGLVSNPVAPPSIAFRLVSGSP